MRILEVEKYTSNPPIIFQSVVIRFNALDEVINFRTENSKYANIFVVMFLKVGKKFESVNMPSFFIVVKEIREGALSWQEVLK